MTVVRRPVRSRVEQRTRGVRRPLAQRYPVGTKVAVEADYFDERFAGRIGSVETTVDDEDRRYPQGRVGLRLVVDELYLAAFGGPPPKTVWFRPSDLERL